MLLTPLGFITEQSCIHADNSLYVICNDFLYSIHILGEDFSLNFRYVAKPVF